MPAAKRLSFAFTVSFHYFRRHFLIQKKIPLFTCIWLPKNKQAPAHCEIRVPYCFISIIGAFIRLGDVSCRVDMYERVRVFISL